MIKRNITNDVYINKNESNENWTGETNGLNESTAECLRIGKVHLHLRR